MQRAQGRVEVIFKPGSESQGSSDQAVALDTLYQSGSAKCLLPRVAGSIPEAVLLNTAGGITGGDRFDIRVGVSGGSAIATSQTAERIYRSAGGVGRVSNTLEIGAGAQLDWLPQETILFEGGQLARQLSVDMAPDATLWALESFVLGRAAMGEDVQTGFVSDQWRIRRGGALIYADGLRLGRKAFASNAPLDQHVGSIAATIAHPAAMAGHRAFANLIHVAPNAADQLGTARTLIAEWLHEHGRDIRMAASTWNGILGLRLLASSGHALRAALGFLLPRLRGAPLPRVWRL
jgi:urease accessory protein